MQSDEAPVSTIASPVLFLPDQMNFEPDRDTPVWEHGEPSDWYAGAVEPGAVIFHDDQFHLFFNGFDGWPAKSSVGYAVSDHGYDWVLSSEKPLLDSNALEFSGFTFFVSSVIQLDDNSWAMYLYTLDEGRDGAPGNILLATAQDLNGPWLLMPEPILAAGEKGSWNGSRVTQPHVIKVDGAYRMYYSGYENDRLQGPRWIGMATSGDGLDWEQTQEPIFYFSEKPTDWDAFRVFQPRVVALEDGFLMLYKSNVSVGRNEAWGLATSVDGYAWERYEDNPIITEKTYKIDWRRNGIADLLLVNGELILFMEILEREGGAYHHGNAGYMSNIFRFSFELSP